MRLTLPPIDDAAGPVAQAIGQALRAAECQPLVAVQALTVVLAAEMAKIPDGNVRGVLMAQFHQTVRSTTEHLPRLKGTREQ